MPTVPATDPAIAVRARWIDKIDVGRGNAMGPGVAGLAAHDHETPRLQDNGPGVAVACGSGTGSGVSDSGSGGSGSGTGSAVGCVLRGSSFRRIYRHCHRHGCMGGRSFSTIRGSRCHAGRLCLGSFSHRATAVCHSPREPDDGRSPHRHTRNLGPKGRVRVDMRRDALAGPVPATHTHTRTRQP
jgi:hypothetical protein